MDIIEPLQKQFGSAILLTEESEGIISITVDSLVSFEAIRYVKDFLNFNFLTDLCAIHYPNQDLPFGVIYHLHNFKENLRLRIKTFLAKEPAIRSITELFPAANWMEREAYDFYGVQFEGHPNLKRILNVDYLDYFPMRKEFPLEDPTRHDKDDRFFGR